MVTMAQEFATSVHTRLEFDQAIDVLRDGLQKEGFEILLEVPFHREFSRQMGISQLSYTVLVVWNPFHALQALLSTPDGGLLVPFNIAVARNGSGTLVSAVNHELVAQAAGSPGVQILAQELKRKLQLSFLRLAIREVAPPNNGNGRQKESL